MNLKKLLNEKMNQTENYNSIISKLERPTPRKKYNWQIGLVTVMFITAISFFIGYTSTKNGILPKNQFSESIYINETAQLGIRTLAICDNQAEFNLVEGENLLKQYSFLEKLEIPFSSKQVEFYSLYKNGKLEEYSYYLESANQEKNILISFNQYEKFTYQARNCQLALYESILTQGKTSTIRETPMKIFLIKGLNQYFVTFTVQEMTFDIKTVNLSEQEVVKLITSIIDNREQEKEGKKNEKNN